MHYLDVFSDEKGRTREDDDWQTKSPDTSIQQRLNFPCEQRSNIRTVQILSCEEKHIVVISTRQR